MHKINNRAILLILLFFQVFFHGFAEDVNDDDEVKFVNLQDLNETELEAICTARGFELIPEVDPSTGEALDYTHDDYVEAAQQCLEVEAEMEKMFKQNPSILNDLEKERDRMQEMKEKLEAELRKKQEELEETRKEHQQRQEEYINTAFLPNDSSVNEEVDSSHNSDDLQEEELSDINLGDTIEESKAPNTDQEFTSSLKKSKIQTLPNNSASTDQRRKGYNPLGLKEIFQEVVQEFRNRIVQDVQLVTNLVFPPAIRKPVMKKVLVPLLKVAKSTGTSATDLVRRYLKLAVEDLIKPMPKEEQL